MLISFWYQLKRKGGGDFPGGPVVRTLPFHCRGRRFDPGSGNEDPTCLTVWPKKKKKKKREKGGDLRALFVQGWVVVRTALGIDRERCYIWCSLWRSAATNSPVC